MELELSQIQDGEMSTSNSQTVRVSVSQIFSHPQVERAKNNS